MKFRKPPTIVHCLLSFAIGSANLVAQNQIKPDAISAEFEKVDEWPGKEGALKPGFVFDRKNHPELNEFETGYDYVRAKRLGIVADPERSGEVIMIPFGAKSFSSDSQKEKVAISFWRGDKSVCDAHHALHAAVFREGRNEGVRRMEEPGGLGDIAFSWNNGLAFARSNIVCVIRRFPLIDDRLLKERRKREYAKLKPPFTLEQVKQKEQIDARFRDELDQMRNRKLLFDIENLAKKIDSGIASSTEQPPETASPGKIEHRAMKNRTGRPTLILSTDPPCPFGFGTTFYAQGCLIQEDARGEATLTSLLEADANVTVEAWLVSPSLSISKVTKEIAIKKLDSGDVQPRDWRLQADRIRLDARERGLTISEEAELLRRYHEEVNKKAKARIEQQKRAAESTRSPSRSP